MSRPNAAESRPPRRRMRLRLASGNKTMYSINVSAGGVCAESMRVLPVGTDVEGVIFLDDHGSSFAGRIAWAHPGDFRLNQLGQMGVRFLEIDPAFEQALEARDARATPAPGAGAKAQK
jgi:hypothetical protein